MQSGKTDKHLSNVVRNTWPLLMGRPRKEAMDKLLIGVMFFMLIGLSVVHESQLRKLEAATYSAQQPKGRDYYVDSLSFSVGKPCTLNFGNNTFYVR